MLTWVTSGFVYISANSHTNKILLKQTSQKLKLRIRAKIYRIFLNFNLKLSQLVLLKLSIKMCTLNNSCFFCGKDVPESDYNAQKDITVDSVGSFDNNNSGICREAVSKSVFQISNYLQIAKDKITYELDALKINICPKCWNISEKLSSMCGELEVIQMKIKYFLNLLTDQILTNDHCPKDINNEVAFQVNQSKFQKTFYQKCKQKLDSKHYI